MKNTSFNTKKTDSRLNSTTVIVLVIAALPILLFALTQIFPPTVDAPTKEPTSVSDTKANRVSAAERRAQRAEARKARNFARADEIRDELLAKGIILKDTREGVKWKRA